MSIQRYEIGELGIFAYNPNGSVVFYGDHLREIAAKDLRIAELEAELASFSWKAITEESLPKTGDEIWGPRSGAMLLPPGYAPIIPMMNDFIFAGWTHYRTLTPPAQLAKLKEAQK